jgi:transporter family-2 protein
VLMMVSAGAFIAFQSPINSALSKTTGVVEAALFSFATGTLALVALALVAGRGDVRAAIGVPWWQWLGGVLGALFVTAFVVCVPRIGVSVAIGCSLAGQLVTAMLVDHFGWFGVAQRSLDVRRVLALPVLALGVWLIQAKK